MHEILRDKKVVFFDVGYTLDRPASGDWMFTNRFLELAGDRLAEHTPEEIEKAREAGMDYLAANHLTPTEDDEADRFIRYFTIVSDKLGLKLTGGEIADIVWDRVRNMDNYIAYPNAKRVTEALSMTHRLGIISDTWPSIGRQLTAIGLLQYFSFRTYSFELGVFKPDPRMYQDALSKCGVPAKETVFIDDVPKNLDGAAAFGITPVLIAANPASDVETPYLKIRSLSELL